MKIYGIYNIKENEQCMRVGTLEEIMMFLNLTTRELGLALRRNATIRNKYEICYLYKEWGGTEDWNT